MPRDLNEVLDEIKTTAEEMTALSAVMDAEGYEPKKEDDEKWEALESKFNGLKVTAEDLKKTASTDAARARRRAVLTGARTFEQSFERAFIRNPDYDPERSDSGKLDLRARNIEEDLNNAFNAWMRMAVNPELIDAEMRDSCARLKVNPGSKTFELPTSHKGYERYLRCLYADAGNDQYHKLGMSLDPRSPFSPYSATNSVPYLDSRVPEGAGYTNQPPSFLGTLERNIVSYGGIFDSPISVRTVPGYEDIVQDFADDQAEGVQIGEGHPLLSGKNPKFGQLRWGSYDYSSLGVVITERQLEVSRYDLADFIGEIQGERLGRVQARKLTWGTGSAEPMGLATAVIKGGNIVETAGSLAITEADIRGLEYALDQFFLRGPGVGFMMNLMTLAYLEGLTNATSGDKVFQLGLETTRNRRILRNFPVYINYMMPTVAANKVAILFGDFSKYLVIRRGRGTPRLIRDVTTLANELKVVFTTLLSLDAKLRNYGNSPLAGLKIKA